MGVDSQTAETMKLWANKVSSFHNSFKKSVITVQGQSFLEPSYVFVGF